MFCYNAINLIGSLLCFYDIILNFERHFVTYSKYENENVVCFIHRQASGDGDNVKDKFAR